VARFHKVKQPQQTKPDIPHHRWIDICIVGIFAHKVLAALIHINTWPPTPSIRASTFRGFLREVQHPKQKTVAYLVGQADANKGHTFGFRHWRALGAASPRCPSRILAELSSVMILNFL
jgi:hypothetical protein